MILYGDHLWDSPWFFTAFVALSEKRIPFQTRVLDLSRGDQRAPSFSGAITGRIPAIEHDGFWLAESSAIVEYVDEAFDGPRLLPSDRQQRARARQILSWLRSDLMPLREERPTTTMFYARATASLSDKARASAQKLLGVTTALLGEREHLFGEWSVADSDLAFMVHRLILNGDEVPEHVRAYAARQWQRPSVRAFVEQERPKR